MTTDDRAALLDLAIVGAASLAVYLVLRNPQLRRTAWRALKYAAFTAAPRLVWRETTRAWEESAAYAQPRAVDRRS
jgi:hypothetical protein